PYPKLRARLAPIQPGRPGGLRTFASGFLQTAGKTPTGGAVAPGGYATAGPATLCLRRFTGPAGVFHGQLVLSLLCPFVAKRPGSESVSGGQYFRARQRRLCGCVSGCTTPGRPLWHPCDYSRRPWLYAVLCLA